MNSKTVGSFICKLRKENNLTQAALAEKLNISNRTVSKWENGDGYPDITILPELANILGVSVDELLAGERKPDELTEIKVTEIENKDTLNNQFLIAFILSLFIGIFGALLGGITEIYSIRAFPILFYTHWEIMFVAVSLFAVIASGLIFSIGVIRLRLAYGNGEIITLVKHKAILLMCILAVFPITFVLRILFWI